MPKIPLVIREGDRFQTLELKDTVCDSGGWGRVVHRGDCPQDVSEIRDNRAVPSPPDLFKPMLRDHLSRNWDNAAQVPEDFSMFSNSEIL